MSSALLVGERQARHPRVLGATCWVTSGRAFWGTRLIELLTCVVDDHDAARS